VIQAAARTQSVGARAHRVLGVRDVSPSAFVVRLERDGLIFRPGQWINVGRGGSLQRREYTIYSPPAEDFLEILVKEVEGGAVSRDLHACRPGDALEVDGPHGSFCIEPQERPGKFLFIGTGTGVSPFHCLALSHPGIDYQLLHGVRTPREMYDHDVFEPGRLIPCISGAGQAAAEKKAYAGRVTSYLHQHPVEAGSACYLCGNSDMIYECYAMLRGFGVPASRIFAEVYF